MKFPVTLVALAIAVSAFAQTTTTPTTKTIKIKSKGEDIRTVIDSIFEQAGKQYVLEDNIHQAMYMNLDGISFEKAIEIISNVGAIECQEKQGVWYIHMRPVASKPAVLPSDVTVPAKTTKPTAAKHPTTSKKTATKAPAKSQSTGKTTPITTDAVNTTKLDPKTDQDSSAQQFAEIAKPALPKLDLTKRLTVQLKKMDIREVFEEFGRQTKIDIEIDENVPNYKLDAYFYSTSLKFALDKICKIANLKYTVTPSKTLRISKI